MRPRKEDICGTDEEKQTQALLEEEKRMEFTLIR